MARKHRKDGAGIRAEVVREIIKPEIVERKIVLNPVTGEYEPVKVVTPAVYKQGRAQSSTTKRGQKNAIENMAPKGTAGAKPLTPGKAKR